MPKNQRLILVNNFRDEFDSGIIIESIASKFNTDFRTALNLGLAIRNMSGEWFA